MGIAREVMMVAEWEHLGWWRGNEEVRVEGHGSERSWKFSRMGGTIIKYRDELRSVLRKKKILRS